MKETLRAGPRRNNWIYCFITVILGIALVAPVSNRWAADLARHETKPFLPDLLGVDTNMLYAVNTNMLAIDNSKCIVEVLVEGKSWEPNTPKVLPYAQTKTLCANTLNTFDNNWYILNGHISNTPTDKMPLK